MSLFSDIKTTLNAMSPAIPCEVGKYTSKPAPDTYCTISFESDNYKCYDDKVDQVVSMATIELFAKGNYLTLAKQIAVALNNAGMCITSGEFVEREADTGYNHYSIDVENTYIVNTN